MDAIFPNDNKGDLCQKTLTIPQRLDLLAKEKNINFSAVLVNGLKQELGLIDVQQQALDLARELRQELERFRTVREAFEKIEIRIRRRKGMTGRNERRKSILLQCWEPEDIHHVLIIWIRIRAIRSLYRRLY